MIEMHGYHDLGQLLRVAADRTNDAADHDEMHAAAEVCRLLAGDAGFGENDYINRWLDGLLRRIEGSPIRRPMGRVCKDVACPGRRNCQDPDCTLART